MAKSFKSKEENIETPIVPQVEETTFTPVVEETSVAEPVIEPVVEVVKPSVNKEEIVAKLAELAGIFRTMYGEQLNPVFAEIHKSLSNAQYKIMQNL
jgi:hypothetical protein